MGLFSHIFPHRELPCVILTHCFHFADNNWREAWTELKLSSTLLPMRVVSSLPILDFTYN